MNGQAECKLHKRKEVSIILLVLISMRIELLQILSKVSHINIGIKFLSQLLSKMINKV
jgi:hypothetical protein